MTDTLEKPQSRFLVAAGPSIEHLAQSVSKHLGKDYESCHARLIADAQIGIRPARSLLEFGLASDELESLIHAESPAQDEQDRDDEISGSRPLRIDDVDKSVAEKMTVAMMKRLEVMPIGMNDAARFIVAATVPELRTRDRREIQKLLGSEFEIYWTDNDSLTTCIELWENAASSVSITEDTGVVVAGESTGRRNYRLLTELSGHQANEQSGLLMQQLLLRAAQLNASDIHIAATRLPNNEVGYQARLRVDGDLQPIYDEVGNVKEINEHVGTALVNRFVTTGDLDPTIQRPRSGRFEIELHNGTRYDLRVEVVPLYGYGLYVVARLLGGAEKLRTIEEIYPPEQSELASLSRRVLSNMRAGGLFLVAGATGSGKSTYLAALMDHLNESDRNLITIENPIEYRLQGVQQIQTQKKYMEFEDAIESSLRLDPDIIMIGELRSPQTVKIAIQAAQTGHMVLSTVHVTDAASTASRFKNLDVNPADVAEVLKGVLAQHLVGTTCSRCIRVGKESKSCAYCGGSGWHGRAAVGELLLVDQDIQELIASGQPPHKIQAAAGYATKAEHAGDLLARNITTLEEIQRKLGYTAGLEAKAKADEIIANGLVNTDERESDD